LRRSVFVARRAEHAPGPWSVRGGVLRWVLVCSTPRCHASLIRAARQAGKRDTSLMRLTGSTGNDYYGCTPSAPGKTFQPTRSHRAPPPSGRRRAVWNGNGKLRQSRENQMTVVSANSADVFFCRRAREGEAGGASKKAACCSEGPTCPREAF